MYLCFLSNSSLISSSSLVLSAVTSLLFLSVVFLAWLMFGLKREFSGDLFTFNLSTTFPDLLLLAEPAFEVDVEEAYDDVLEE